MPYVAESIVLSGEDREVLEGRVRAGTSSLITLTEIPQVCSSNFPTCGAG